MEPDITIVHVWLRRSVFVKWSHDLDSHVTVWKESKSLLLGMTCTYLVPLGLETTT